MHSVSGAGPSALRLTTWMMTRKYVSRPNTSVDTNVPPTANTAIAGAFLKKSFFFSVKPAWPPGPSLERQASSTTRTMVCKPKGVSLCEVACA